MESKLVFGVGVNDANYSVTSYGFVLNRNGESKYKQIWMCPYYRTWKNILARCYSKPLHEKRPSYSLCTICDEWLVFSKFKGWMETQDWEGNQLDKDLSVPGNKTYGPEFCLFVSGQVNRFILAADKSRGEHPIGVFFDRARGLFVSMCCNPFTGEQELIGYTKTADTAHKMWLTRKLELAKMLAEIQSDERVSAALVRRYTNFKED